MDFRRGLVQGLAALAILGGGWSLAWSAAAGAGPLELSADDPDLAAALLALPERREVRLRGVRFGDATLPRTLHLEPFQIFSPDAKVRLNGRAASQPVPAAA